MNDVVALAFWTLSRGAHLMTKHRETGPKLAIIRQSRPRNPSFYRRIAHSGPRVAAAQ